MTTTKTSTDIWCLAIGFKSSADPVKRTKKNQFVTMLGFTMRQFARLERPTSMKNLQVVI